jgi:hypothetical protein
VINVLHKLTSWFDAGKRTCNLSVLWSIGISKPEPDFCVRRLPMPFDRTPSYHNLDEPIIQSQEQKTRTWPTASKITPTQTTTSTTRTNRLLAFDPTIIPRTRTILPTPAAVYGLSAYEKRDRHLEMISHRLFSGDGKR